MPAVMATCIAQQESKHNARHHGKMMLTLMLSGLVNSYLTEEVEPSGHPGFARQHRKDQETILRFPGNVIGTFKCLMEVGTGWKEGRARADTLTCKCSPIPVGEFGAPGSRQIPFYFTRADRNMSNHQWWAAGCAPEVGPAAAGQRGHDFRHGNRNEHRHAAHQDPAAPSGVMLCHWLHLSSAYRCVERLHYMQSMQAMPRSLQGGGSPTPHDGCWAPICPCQRVVCCTKGTRKDVRHPDGWGWGTAAV